MKATQYQVMRVKPKELEAALNQMAGDGWQVHSILLGETAGRRWAWSGTSDVTRYHVVFWRNSQ